MPTSGAQPQTYCEKHGCYTASIAAAFLVFTGVITASIVRIVELTAERTKTENELERQKKALNVLNRESQDLGFRSSILSGSIATARCLANTNVAELRGLCTGLANADFNASLLNDNTTMVTGLGVHPFNLGFTYYPNRTAQTIVAKTEECNCSFHTTCTQDSACAERCRRTYWRSSDQNSCIAACPSRCETQKNCQTCPYTQVVRDNYLAGWGVVAQGSITASTCVPNDGVRVEDEGLQVTVDRSEKYYVERTNKYPRALFFRFLGRPVFNGDVVGLNSQSLRLDFGNTYNISQLVYAGLRFLNSSCQSAQTELLMRSSPDFFEQLIAVPRQNLELVRAKISNLSALIGNQTLVVENAQRVSDRAAVIYNDQILMWGMMLAFSSTSLILTIAHASFRVHEQICKDKKFSIGQNERL